MEVQMFQRWSTFNLNTHSIAYIDFSLKFSKIIVENIRILNRKIKFQASCIDSTAQPEAVFAAEVKKLQADKLKPLEQITLEPYERDHAVVVGSFRPPAKKAAA